MINHVDGKTLAQMFVLAAKTVQDNLTLLNDLNVFPVPDGDTGTNMSLTLNSLSFTADAQSSVATVSDLAASSLLRGARGNSGVILSLLFRGFARSCKDCETLNAAGFANAFSEAVDCAYKAVMKPAEGTILTVARVSAEYALQLAADIEDITEFLQKTIVCAKDALAETTKQNPVLEKAGVVDAGAMGYVFILESMLGVLTGQEVEVVTVASAPAAKLEMSTQEITFGYCTEMIILKGEKEIPLDKFKAFLNARGDSIVCVDGGDIIKLHIHTNNPGKIMEEALKFGALDKIKIENMRIQHSEQVAAQAAAEENPERVIAEPEKKYGFVAVAAGEGVASAFSDFGVDNIISGGQTMNPSTEDILTAIDKTPSEIVFVLPNNKNIIMAANQAAALTTKQVIVIPSKFVTTGLGAMMAFDPEADPEQNRNSMTAALENIKTGEITFAVRDSVFDGKKIKEGDFLALVNGKISAFGNKLDMVLKKMLKQLDMKEASFITVFSGQDASEEQIQTVMSFVEANSDCEVLPMEGGQPVYYFIISVE